MKKEVNSHFIGLISILFIVSCNGNRHDFSKKVFSDDFSTYKTGLVSPPVGPHTEYHYLKEARPSGQWTITSFYFNPRGADTAWSVRNSGGNREMCQTIKNTNSFTHPMITAGNKLWRDYRVSVAVTPATGKGRTGLIFRYRNDRQYYFFGLENDSLRLLRVSHEKDFHVPDEMILESVPADWKPGETHILEVSVKEDLITAACDGKVVMETSDTTFGSGKIALMSDFPAVFDDVTVFSSVPEVKRIEAEEKRLIALENEIVAENPAMTVWRKIPTPGFGMGRNLRFGDLNSDGKTDILIGQVIHHAYPRDSFSELSCLTAIDTEGNILWQKGSPSPDHQTLTNDVAFQIHDINNDGKNEVIYTMNCEIIIAEGTTGKVLLKKPTPEKKAAQYDPVDPKKVVREWPNILGDCLFFCDLRGQGRAGDIVIKDRYSSFWVLDEKLDVQWKADCRTGHYPYSRDINGDGREELFIGYSAYNFRGEVLWSLDNKLKDHCDGIGVVNFNEKPGSDVKVFIAGSDQGAVVADADGTIKKIHLVGHVQNPAIANFRPDLPGLETLSINFWGNQGIIHFYDSDHNIYHDFEPVSYGSMCLPVNWTGSGEEFFALSANVEEGGLFDGWGRRAVRFPDDGHPEMCNAVLDITGDVRDELIVWDTESIWIYTQDNSPLAGRLYKPLRNPLYNYSNYQLSVSEEGWNE